MEIGWSIAESKQQNKHFKCLLRHLIFIYLIFIMPYSNLLKTRQKSPALI